MVALRLICFPSDPFHERYGNYLSVEEVNSLAAPHQQSVDAVEGWLASHGFLNEDFVRSPANDWVKVKVPVQVAELMMNAVCYLSSKLTHLTELLLQEYHVWVHSDTGKAIIRTTQYSLPSEVFAHVDFIQPTTLFSAPRKMSVGLHQYADVPADADPNAPPISVPSAYKGQVDASCNSTITISCLQQLYNMVGYTPSAHNGNKIGITAYLEQYANLADLQKFYADQRPDALNSSFEFISVKGESPSTYRSNFFSNGNLSSTGGLNNQSLEAAGVEANLGT